MPPRQSPSKPRTPRNSRTHDGSTAGAEVLAASAVSSFSDDAASRTLLDDDLSSVGASHVVTPNGAATADELARYRAKKARVAKRDAEEAKAKKTATGSAPIQAAELPRTSDTIALPAVDLSAPVISPSPVKRDVRRAVRPTDLVEDGGTFTIDAVTAPYEADNGSRDVRGVRIVLTDEAGQPVIRWTTFGEIPSMGARNAFLATCQQHCERGACPGLYRIVARAASNAQDIVPCDASRPTKIPAVVQPTPAPARTAADAADILARYDTEHHAMVPLTVNDGDPIDWAHGDVGDEDRPCAGVIMLRTVGPSNDRRLEATTFMRAQIRINGIRTKGKAADNQSTLYDLTIIEEDGSERHCKKTLSDLTGRDKGLADLVSHCSIPGHSPTVHNQLSSYLARLAALWARTHKTVTELDFMGWHHVTVDRRHPDRSALRYVMIDGVETPDGFRTHDETRLVPSSSRYEDAELAQCITSPLIDTTKAASPGDTLDALRDIITLRSDVDHVNAAQLGHAVYAMSPVRAAEDDTPVGHGRFFLEIFGPRTCGKSSMVSALDPLFGAGFKNAINPGTLGKADKNDVTYSASSKLLSWFPGLRQQSADAKMGEEETLMKERPRLINQVFDRRSGTIGTRYGAGFKSRGEIRTSVVGTIEYDQQIIEAQSKSLESLAMRYLAIEMTPATRSDAMTVQHHRVKSVRNRFAIACFGADMRRWWMNVEPHDLQGAADDIHQVAYELADPVRHAVDGSRFADHLVVMATGCLWVRRFLCEVYGDDAADIIAWIDRGLAQLADYVGARNMLLFSEAPKIRAASHASIVRHALVNAMAQQGHVVVKKEMLPRIIDILEPHGLSPFHFGLRKSNGAAPTYDPINSDVVGYLGKHDDGSGSDVDCLIIPTGRIKDGSLIVRAVNQALKHGGQSRASSASQIEKMIAEIAIPHEGKGQHLKRYAPRVDAARCIIITLKALFDLDDVEAPVAIVADNLVAGRFPIFAPPADPDDMPAEHTSGAEAGDAAASSADAPSDALDATA